MMSHMRTVNTFSVSRIFTPSCVIIMLGIPGNWAAVCQDIFSRVYESVREGYFQGVTGAHQKPHTLYSVCPHA